MLVDPGSTSIADVAAAAECDLAVDDVDARCVDGDVVPLPSTGR